MLADWTTWLSHELYLQGLESHLQWPEIGVYHCLSHFGSSCWSYSYVCIYIYIEMCFFLMYNTCMCINTYVCVYIYICIYAHTHTHLPLLPLDAIICLFDFNVYRFNPYLSWFLVTHPNTSTIGLLNSKEKETSYPHSNFEWLWPSCLMFHPQRPMSLMLQTS